MAVGLVSPTPTRTRCGCSERMGHTLVPKMMQVLQDPLQSGHLRRTDVQPSVALGVLAPPFPALPGSGVYRMTIEEQTHIWHQQLGQPGFSLPLMISALEFEKVSF